MNIAYIVHNEVYLYQTAQCMYLFVCIYCAYFRNSATTTIEQELKFVGTESGKLLAVRDIIAKVNQIVKYL